MHCDILDLLSMHLLGYLVYVCCGVLLRIFSQAVSLEVCLVRFALSRSFSLYVSVRVVTT